MTWMKDGGRWVLVRNGVEVGFVKGLVGNGLWWCVVRGRSECNNAVVGLAAAKRYLRGFWQ